MALAPDEEGALLRTVLTARGGTEPVLNALDHFYQYRMPQILSSGYILTNSGLYATFSNPFFSRPTIHDLKGKGRPRPLYPFEARRSRLSYMGQLHAKLELKQFVNGQYVPIPGQSIDVYLGKVPVAVGSFLCNTYGLTPEERYQRGEPTHDPQAYFIIKGGEKVLLNIEKLRTLAPYLYEEKEKFMVRYTSQTLTDTSVVIVFEDRYDVHVTFTKMGISNNSINIFYIFYALGLINNTVETVYQLMETFIVDEDPKRQARRRREMRYFMQTTENTFRSQTGLDQRRIFDLLAGKFKDPDIINNVNRNTLLMQAIQTDLFKNISLATARSQADVTTLLTAKIRLLASMAAKYVDFRNGYRSVDDRDAWGNKQLADAAKHMSSRFVQIWKQMIATIQAKVKGSGLSTAAEIKGAISQNYMAEQFITSFSKELWGNSRGTREVTVVEVLKRDNMLAAWSHIRRISTPTNRRAQIREKRLIHNTQWGVACPVFTPEGEACGLVKDSAVTIYVSVDRDDSIIRARIDGRYNQVPQPGRRNPLYLNGVPLGYCNSKELRDELVRLRRSQQIYFDTGIILNQYQELWVYTNDGRVCRPLLVVDQDTQELAIDRFPGLRGNADLSTLMSHGVIEYVDVAEQEQPQTFIAQTTRHLRARRERNQETVRRNQELLDDPNTTPGERQSIEEALRKARSERKFSHAEIDPTAIMGLSAISMPFAEFNPGPRDTYQAAMVRQALGPNSSRIELRFDTTMRTIIEPGVPVITTDAHEWLGLDEYPQGQELILAITTYGGQNQEDAIIINGDAIDRGFFMMMIYHSYTTTICQSKGRQEKVQVPDYPAAQSARYSKLDPDTGIVRVGETVQAGDCLVGRVIVDVATGQVSNGSLYVEVGKQGVVDEVFVTENAEACRLIRIRIRELRKLQAGDKLASRYSQKGTIGEILPGRIFPWIVSDKRELNGVRPHAIFNPHGIPSRMTIGKLYELLTGKLAAIKGERYLANAFRRFNIEDIQDELAMLGFTRSGKERMVNGVTGREMDVDIYIGPVYYQLLRHLVQDKMQARGTGAVQFQTRQPNAGIRKEGGLRVGEMERDALIEYGAAYLTQERMVISSDAWQGIVCRTCGQFANLNVEQGNFRCRACREDAEFTRIQIPYAFKLMTQILAASHVKLKLGTREI